MHNYESLGFFDFEDFVEELTDEQLFAINGGACAGGAPSGGHGPTGGGSCGGGYNPSCGGGNSTSYPTPTSGCGGGVNPPTTYAGQCAGGSPSGPSYIPTTPPTCGGGYDSDTSRSITNFLKKMVALVSVNKSISKNLGYKYGEKINGLDFCCDNWVEKVLDDAGYDSSYYLTAGDSTKKIAEHIASLKKSSNPYVVTVPTEPGVYVVFMDGNYTMKSGPNAGQTITADPHCGILTVDTGGGMSFTHNSRSNDNKGVATQITSPTALNTALTGLTYSNFYFQEVK